MDDELQNKINYFSSWVRLHSDSDVSRWTLQQLIDSFLLLPQPHTSFSDWMMIKNKSNEKELSEDEKIINNEKFITALKKNKPDYIQIEEKA